MGTNLSQATLYKQPNYYMEAKPMKRMMMIACLTLTLFVGSANFVLADGIIITEPCDLCPGPFPPPEREVPYLTVKNHRVNVMINDQVATTKVDQTFRNDSQWSLEGTYIFPMPEDAAINDFAMWIDGERIEGQLYTKEEARRIYDQIVRRKLDPALLEYIGRDLFQASIFPIEPGDTRRVQIEYTEILPIDNGLVNYVYPLNTEKFSHKPLENVAVTVEITSSTPIKTVYAASHPASVTRDGRYQALLGWEDFEVLPETDFSLYYTLSDDDIGLNLLSYKEPDEDGFFLMFVSPNIDAGQDEVVDKDVIMVLDTSGSMEGEKMAQAKEALSYVLDHLNPNDRFNIVAFSTGIRTFANRLRPVSAVREAHRFVDNLEPGGSTDINRALIEAITMADSERPTIVIFLTDGLPTSGVVDTPIILNNVDQNAGDNLRVFPFGVGDDVDTFLLDNLGQTLRGTTAYVRPGEAIDEHVSSFYAKVSTPVLADITLEVSNNLVLEETYPYPLPDLFAGTQLIVAGRYRSGGAAVITLTGQINSEPRTFTYEDIVFMGDAQIAVTSPVVRPAEFVPRLWATRKIGHLLQQIRLSGENREAIDEIVSLSIRYGIITPYTSFLVEEPEMALREESRSNFANEIFEEEVAFDAPASGGAAVDQAVVQKSMAEADMAAPLPQEQTANLNRDRFEQEANSSAPLKVVGPKTFVLKDGVWTDTEYDPSRMTTTQIPSMSDAFFEFLTNYPNSQRYFALGTRVIVVLDGVAYETTE